MNNTLQILDSFSEELLHCPVSHFYSVLQKPTLFCLKGGREPALFLSLLLHGNEHTSVLAFQRFMQKYQKRLPRSTFVFVGNIEAAQSNQRKLDHQEDYNRIWSEDAKDCTEKKIAHEILHFLQDKKLFASVDIHNNTGKNPHYACISSLKAPYLHLARLFSRTVVYFNKPHSTQSVTFTPLTPAMTIECGFSGEESGTQKVFQFLEDLFHLSHLPETALPAHDLDCFETFAKICVPPSASFEFGNTFKNPSSQFLFRSDLDSLNFSELPAGEMLGFYRTNERLTFSDPDGAALSSSVLKYEEGKIILGESVIPSMFTLDQKVISQDCLGYLMRRKKIVVCD